MAGEWRRNGWRVTILCGRLDGQLLASIPAGIEIRKLAEHIPPDLLAYRRFFNALPFTIDRLRADILFLPGHDHLGLAGTARYLPRAPEIVAMLAAPAAAGSFLSRRILERLMAWAGRDVHKLPARSPLPNHPDGDLSDRVHAYLDLCDRLLGCSSGSAGDRRPYAREAASGAPNREQQRTPSSPALRRAWFGPTSNLRDGEPL